MHDQNGGYNRENIDADFLFCFEREGDGKASSSSVAFFLTAMAVPLLQQHI